MGVGVTRVRIRGVRSRMIGRSSESESTEGTDQLEGLTEGQLEWLIGGWLAECAYIDMERAWIIA